MTKYIVTWLALVALATLSLLVSSGAGLALAIASIKAVLVAGIFMRVRGTHRAALIMAAVFLVLLVLGVLADVGTRDLASAYEP